MSSKFTKLMAGAALLTLLPAGQAWAVGTAAGTDVNNTFTLEYRVNNTGAPVTLTNPGDGSHEANFKVDRMVDVLVEVDSTPTPGGIGDAVQHVFTITNEGNATQAYDLAIAENTGDAFDVTANSTFEISYDGGATYGPYTPGSTTSDVLADGEILLRVTTTIPAGLDIGDSAEFAVVATTREIATPTIAGVTGGAVVTATPATNTNGDETVETVFRDDIGDTGGTTGVDANTDGKHSDTAVVQVDSAADITATKTVALLETDTTDATCLASTATPVAAANAVFAPGACVEYTITVTNSGGSQATDIRITDDLSGNLIFISTDASDLSGNFAPANNGKQPNSAGPCGTGAVGVVGGTAIDCEIIMVDGTVPGNGGSGSTSAVLKIRARVP